MLLVIIDPVETSKNSEAILFSVLKWMNFSNAGDALNLRGSSYKEGSECQHLQDLQDLQDLQGLQTLLVFQE